MLNGRIIIADASSIIALNNIDRLDVLKSLFVNISITPEVSEEFGLLLPDWIQIIDVKDRDKIRLLMTDLDIGEASAIALALEHPASLLIIDERRGRRYARQLGIRLIGILGILVQAKEQRLIDRLADCLNDLERVGFRMSESLKKQILIRAGEWPGQVR